MHWNERRKTTEIVSNVLQSEGFTIRKDFRVGSKFVDILGLRESDKKAVLIEIKSHELDSSDVMQIESYTGSLRAMNDFADKNIISCVVAPGGISPSATHLAKDLKVHLITTDKEEKLRQQIKECITPIF